MIVAHDNGSESLREAKLAADVNIIIIARENESESLREAILAAHVECR